MTAQVRNRERKWCVCVLGTGPNPPGAPWLGWYPGNHPLETTGAGLSVSLPEHTHTHTHYLHLTVQHSLTLSLSLSCRSTIIMCLLAFVVYSHIMRMSCCICVWMTKPAKFVYFCSIILLYFSHDVEGVSVELHSLSLRRCRLSKQPHRNTTIWKYFLKWCINTSVVQWSSVNRGTIERLEGRTGIGIPRDLMSRERAGLPLLPSRSNKKRVNKWSSPQSISNILFLNRLRQSDSLFNLFVKYV